MVSRNVRMLLLFFLLLKFSFVPASPSYSKEDVQDFMSKFPSDVRLVDFDFFKHLPFIPHKSDQEQNNVPVIAESLVSDATDSNDYSLGFAPIEIFMIVFVAMLVLVFFIILIMRREACIICLRDSCCNANAAPTPTATVTTNMHRPGQQNRNALRQAHPPIIMRQIQSQVLPTVVTSHRPAPPVPITQVNVNSGNGHRIRLTPPPSYNDIFGEEDEKVEKQESVLPTVPLPPTAPPASPPTEGYRSPPRFS